MLPGGVSTMYIIFFSRLIVATTLVLGGTGKLLKVAAFRNIIYANDILPNSVVPLASFLLPICELVVGVSVLFVKLQPGAGLLAATLFLVFTAAIIVNLRRGRFDIYCGCFGSPAKRISWRLVSRNAAFVSAAVASTGLTLVYSFLLFGLSIIVFVLSGSVIQTRERIANQPQDGVS